MTHDGAQMPKLLEEDWRKLNLWHPSSLRAAMKRGAEDTPGAPLHFFSGTYEHVTTLGEMHAKGQHLAGSLFQLGLRPGNTIAVQVPNSMNNVLLFHAVAALGCTLLPIVHIYGPHELAQILEDSRADAIIVPDRWRNIDYLERLARLPHLPHLRHRIVIADSAPRGMITLKDLPSGTLPEVVFDDEAIALLLYTSGTTAKPKGVRHTSRGLLAELYANRGEDLRNSFALSPWPSGHIAGTLNILAHALLGRPLVLLESWDPLLAAQLVERFKVRQMSGTPFHLSGLLEARSKNNLDLTSFTQFIVGAATVPPALVAASEAQGIRCCRCYGSTEMPTVSLCSPDDPIEKRLNTDGRPNPGVEVKIVDQAGNQLDVGLEGEVAVRGPERFLGYTDANLNTSSFLADGWFLTGDIGRLDADGFLAITDRKKDIIIRGGENISSREVEELLLLVPGVKEAAAIAAADSKLGERVCAVVATEDGAEVTIESIAAVFHSLGVARQKTPEILVLVDEFPRTPTGKVQKAELRRILASC